MYARDLGDQYSNPSAHPGFFSNVNVVVDALCVWHPANGPAPAGRAPFKLATAFALNDPNNDFTLYLVPDLFLRVARSGDACCILKFTHPSLFF